MEGDQECKTDIGRNHASGTELEGDCEQETEMKKRRITIMEQKWKGIKSV